MNYMKGVASSVLFIGAFFLTGCTAVVRPTVSQTEFMNSDTKIPAVVVMHVTDDFRKYSAEHFDWWCDATKYKMEIGPFATDWFRYALESKFSDVSLVSGGIEFPYNESDVDVILTPKFTSFKAGGPVVVKLEQYWVELGMDITFQDREGNVLETLNLKEKGSQGGTIGVNPGVHLYPNICRLAIKPLADKTIAKTIELVEHN